MSVSCQNIIFKVIVIGDANVGKTALMHHFVKKRFSGTYSTTIGADFLVKDIMIDNQHITLQIWDTAGQERFQSLGSAFYRGADCCILVCDVNNLKTFENLKDWRTEFLALTFPSDRDNFPFLVIGNKIDRCDRKVAATEAEKWCESINDIPYLETSAKEGVNVERAFHMIARTVLKLQKKRIEKERAEINKPPEQIKLNEDTQSKSRGCKC